MLVDPNLLKVKRLRILVITPNMLKFNESQICVTIEYKIHVSRYRSENDQQETS